MPAKARRNGPLFFGENRVTWDVPSTATLAQQTTTVNVPNAKVGDSVTVTPDAPAAGFIYQGYVSAPSVVTLRAINGTSGTVDPAITLFTVLVQRQF